MSKQIKTCDEFEAALRRVRFAQTHAADTLWTDVAPTMPLRPYGLWKVLLDLVRKAIAQRDWAALGELLRLYDRAMLAGERSEMIEGSYVSFMEELHLPTDPADLRKFWQACPPAFLQELQRHHGIRRGR